MEALPTLVLMLGAIGIVSLIARRVAIPGPVLLAIAGVVWSLVPMLPAPRIPPGAILAVFLPPLLYSDAWGSSWIDFRRWLRPILQLAVGLVGFTILTVGVVAHWALPGLPWPACFLLGAIVSPTDTVAVHAVLDRLRAPRRLTAVLSGESLVNDATGLLGVGLATAVMLSGVFESARIVSSFARIAGLGLAIGVAVGVAAATVNYLIRGTHVLFAFSLLAPYAAYFLAERAGASGILAVVVAGFVAAWRVHDIAPGSRVELYASWEQLVYVLNGVLFLYVGLETPGRLMRSLEEVPGIATSALLIGLTVILARIVWVFPNAYLSLWLSPRLRRREGGYPRPRAVAVASWCGVRGAVSLAAALSVPMFLPDGAPFPGRSAIVACTLVVILVTLIGQGVTLHPLVRRLGLSDSDPTDAEVRRARETILSAGIARLDAFCSEEKCPIAVYRLRDAMSDQLATMQEQDEIARAQAAQRLSVAVDVRRAVYEAQTKALLALRDQGMINDKVHRDLQLELDRANGDVRTGLDNAGTGERARRAARPDGTDSADGGTSVP